MIILIFKNTVQEVFSNKKKLFFVDNIGILSNQNNKNSPQKIFCRLKFIFKEIRIILLLLLPPSQ